MKQRADILPALLAVSGAVGEAEPMGQGRDRNVPNVVWHDELPASEQRDRLSRCDELDAPAHGYPRDPRATTPGRPHQIYAELEHRFLDMDLSCAPAQP